MGKNPRCDFNHKQTGNSTGKFVFNGLRSQDSWFRRLRTAGQDDLTRKIMQQGKVGGFNGKMTGNLGLTREIC